MIIVKKNQGYIKANVGLALFLMQFFGLHSRVVAQGQWSPFKDGVVYSSPTIDLLSSTTSEVTAKVEIPGMESFDIQVEDETYQRLTIPAGGHTTEEGNPELPTIGRFVEIPYGIVPKVTVINCICKTIDGYNVYPSQEPLPDVGIDPQVVEFKKNNDTYSTDRFYPSKIVALDQPHTLRGHRIVLIAFYPVQYNPVSKQLKVYTDIMVKIELEGTPFWGAIKEDRFFQPLLSRFVLNYIPTTNPSFEAGGLQKAGDFSTGGADYLIITHDDFYDNILPLAQWRLRKGLMTRIAKKSDVEEAGYTWTADNTWDSTYTGIDGYIKDAYDNWEPAPSYVLLIGDADYLPTHYINNHPYSGERYKKTATDLYYGAMDDANDSLSYVPFPDIFIGRLPVDGTNNDIGIIVNKTLNYEIGPYILNTDWFTSVLLACQIGRLWHITSNYDI